jgi:uncharacterized repeat protein (TIGR01451 family)
LAWAFFVSIGYCDIANFSSYVQYNNLALEDTQAGPYSNIVNGTYTVPVLNITKYSINRRLYPSGTNWSDTLSVNAVGNDTVEYKVTWQQAGVGAPADTIALMDILPSGITFIDSQIVSGGGTITYSVGTLQWFKNNVAASEAGTITYRVRVNP